ncbi:MAG: aspartate aminotransferase family protein [Ilumatobacter coccineus]|uniref:Aspartate aminotransferase family protein n=1 Tax=Ilumatobacter coccineus TaxID=467094 RepID=A0A2G6K7M2_9ACTN|nr:MAG: aspartate aminotransferase family protein [Ilumatobacter coccineus]
MTHLSNVWFKVTDLKVVSGSGCRVRTVDGRDYLDFSSGLATTRFFFTNSGAEAVEAAVKLAKQVTRRPNVIVFKGSFHGRTHLGMAMTTSKSIYRAGYAPLPSGVAVAPFPNPLVSDHAGEIKEALKTFDRILKSQSAPSETAAVVLEPVLGEGGYVPAPQAFIEGIVNRCKEHGILFIADEVQTGFGRTGRWFALDHYDLDPDILVMGKGIASGFPFAAIGTRQELDEQWPVGSHGGTYGGNPIGCAAALATIEVMSDPGFMKNVNARGVQLRDRLSELKEHHPGLRQVRGPGLMVATSFRWVDRAAAVIDHCRDHGNLILMSAGTNGHVVRWMPPLVVTAEEIDEAVNVFSAALRATET